MSNGKDTSRFSHILSEHSLRFESSIERIVCMQHCTTVSCTAKSVGAHLRLHHKEEGYLFRTEHNSSDLLRGVIKRKRKLAKISEAVRLANNSCVGRKHALFNKYHSAGPCDVLPPIRDLPIYRECFRCPIPTCGTIVRFIGSMRKHVAENHRGWDSSESVLNRNCKRVSAQTLVATKRKYFAVYDPDIEEKLAKKHVLELSSRVERDQGCNKMNRESSEGLCDALLGLFDESESEVGDQEENCRRQTAAFLTQSSVEANLRNMRIDIEEAEKLTSLTLQSDDRFSQHAFEGLQRACERYILLVEEAKRRECILPGDLHRLSTPGYYSKTKTQEFQQTWATKVRYSNRMKGLVGMTFRLLNYNGNNKFLNLSAQIKKHAVQLLDCLEENNRNFDETVINHLHQLFQAIFLESSPQRRGTDMFIYTYQNCVCVEKVGEGVQFRQGLQVSPFVAAVMFFASACAVLEVFHFCDPTDRTTEIERIEEAFMVRANSPITLLSGLRALCARIRVQELQQQQVCFVECTRRDHPPMCGAVKLEHISPELVGKTILRMHDTAHILLMRLFPRKPIPPELISGLEQLQDVGERRDCGYSVYSEEQNRGILTEANKWVIEQVGSELLKSKRLKQNWLASAKRLHRLVISLIFLAGGAPCRLTELSSILIENSSAKRGIYFIGKNIAVAPGYAKQLSRNAGVFKPVVRVLDKESSTIVRKYFVFVRPLLVKISGATQKERKCLTLQETDLSKLMRTQFLHLRFPGNVRIYRQWFNGYAKRRSTVAGLVVSASDRGSSSGLEYQNEKQSDSLRDGRIRSSMLRQSAHSVRTAKEIYGVTQGYFGADFTLRGSLYEAFRTASAEFHSDCHLEH